MLGGLQRCKNIRFIRFRYFSLFNLNSDVLMTTSNWPTGGQNRHVNNQVTKRMMWLRRTTRHFQHPIGIGRPLVAKVTYHRYRHVLLLIQCFGPLLHILLYLLCSLYFVLILVLLTRLLIPSLVILLLVY